MRSDDVPLGDHLRRLERMWRPVAGGALAGAAIGVALVVTTPPVYRSTTSVLVADAPQFLPDRLAPHPRRFSMDTEAERVASAPVLAAVARRVGDRSPADRLEVTAVPNTKVLRITYRSASPSLAARGSETAAQAYLDLRHAALVGRRDARVGAIAEELRTLDDQLGTTAAGTHATAAQRVQRTAISRRIAGRQAETRAVETTSVYPGEIVRRHEAAPGERRNKSVPVTGGLALGGLLGGTVAGRRSTRPPTSRRRGGAR